MVAGASLDSCSRAVLLGSVLSYEDLSSAWLFASQVLPFDIISKAWRSSGLVHALSFWPQETAVGKVWMGREQFYLWASLLSQCGGPWRTPGNTACLAAIDSCQGSGKSRVWIKWDLRKKKIVPEDNQPIGESRPAEPGVKTLLNGHLQLKRWCCVLSSTAMHLRYRYGHGQGQTGVSQSDGKHCSLQFGCD